MEAVAVRLCEECRTEFEPRTTRQRFCRNSCAERFWGREYMKDPAYVLASRKRTSDWCREHRNCHTPNPWLAGAPPYGTHLPGISMSIDVRPVPKWPIELRNTRGLHGALSTILLKGEDAHHQRFPFWFLRPWQSGWSVHWFHFRGPELANGLFHVPVYDRPSSVKLGPAVRLRAPVVTKRGRQRVRLETVTPISIRCDGGATSCGRPTAKALVSALGVEFLRRIQPFDGWAEHVEPRIRIEVEEIRTHPVVIPIGGKIQRVPGFEGSVDLEVNAVGRWLLEAASRIGFGGRVAYGFGCIRMTELP